MVPTLTVNIVYGERGSKICEDADKNTSGLRPNESDASSMTEGIYTLRLPLSRGCAYDHLRYGSAAEMKLREEAEGPNADG